VPLCGFAPPHFAVAGLATQALLCKHKTSVTWDDIRPLLNPAIRTRIRGYRRRSGQNAVFYGVDFAAGIWYYVSRVASPTNI